MKLEKLTFAIITHVYTTGPSFRLEDYLKDKVDSLVFIGHPFSYAKDTSSFLRIYKKGKLVSKKNFIQWKGPELSFYLKDLCLTLWWLLRFNRIIDILVGVDNLNASAGYLLKLLGRARKVIFYTIDYVPQRFASKLLNSIYHYFDRFAVKRSDKVWNLSSKMVDEREKRGVGKEFRNKQIVVPIGTNVARPPLPFDKINRHKIVFMGHLREGQGLDLLISAMSDVIKKEPKTHLLIIGGGPLEDKLKKKAIQIGLQKYIKFSGFVENFSDVEKMLRDAAIAVAPYVDNAKTYARYTDPGKPKDYLASALPVVITKVPQVAFEIKRKNCGIAINYDRKELSGALVKLLKNDKLLKAYRKNALGMAKEYTWKKIFHRALTETLE
jgi:glycosyltransferase involved in cell wall biosynthesis